MNLFKRYPERGQAAVLLVLAMVVLLGFTALAVDGSMVYSDRRFAQSGADASSLAGGAEAGLAMDNAGITWSNWPSACTGDPGTVSIPSQLTSAAEAAKAAAVSRAGSNDFAIAANQNEDGYNDVVVFCGSAVVGGFVDKFMDIRTRITETTETSFAHFVYGGTLEQRVEAITRVRPRQPLAFGNAIVALNTAGCQGQQNGAMWTGNADTYIDGGGVFSNGCLHSNGHPTIDVVNGTNTYVLELGGGSSFNPTPQQVPDVLPPDSYYVPPPDCTGHMVSASSLSSPLSPGLYCVTGSISLNGHDSLEGTGVTLYMVDGGITMNGNSGPTRLIAPDNDPDPSPAIPGLVIFMRHEPLPGYPDPNCSQIKINGTSDNYFQGTILAPCSNIFLAGTASTVGYRSQFIGWNVECHGNDDLYIYYPDNLEYMKSAYLDLWR